MDMPIAPGSLLIDQQYISFASLQQHLPDWFNDLSPERQDAVQFCQQWLQGKEQFELQTSGSTGMPKPIKVSRALMEHSARRTAQALQLRPGAYALVCLPLQYIAAKMMLVRALTVQMQAVLIPPAGNPLARQALRNRIDFCALVPFQIEQILQFGESRQQLDQMGTIILGGGAVSPQLVHELQSIKPAVYATYGMTETVSHIALQRLNGPAPDSYFRALGEVTFATDERDCLMIHNHDGQGTVLETNDRVALQNKQQFEWLGRADFVINSGGIKLQPEAIEQKIAVREPKSLSGRKYLMSQLPDQQLGHAVVLVLEGNQLTEPEATALKADLADTLTRYERPKAICYLPQFPMTPTGKLKRAAVAALIKS